MELRTLRYFVVVAQELNITHAADKLNISQPPLSNQIKSLEEELGITLFKRGKRHLQLTEAGKLFYRRALQILDLTERSVQEVRDLHEGLSGTIAIGTVEGRAPFLAARWITGFREEFPLVRYSMWNGSSDDVLDRLAHGLVDLALIAAPYDHEHLDGFAVGREPWVAMIPLTNPLSCVEGDYIPLRLLKEEPLIVPYRASRIRAIEAWFKEELDAEPKIVCRTSNYLDAVALTEQGVGISIFPQTTYTPNDLIVTKIISESERQIKYHLLWNRGQSFSAATEEFVNFVRDKLEEEYKNPFESILHYKEYIPPEDTRSL